MGWCPPTDQSIGKGRKWGSLKPSKCQGTLTQQMGLCSDGETQAWEELAQLHSWKRRSRARTHGSRRRVCLPQTTHPDCQTPPCVCLTPCPPVSQLTYHHPPHPTLLPCPQSQSRQMVPSQSVPPGPATLPSSGPLDCFRSQVPHLQSGDNRSDLAGLSRGLH